MAKYRLSAGPNLAAGSHVNLAALDVFQEDGTRVTRIEPGDSIVVADFLAKDRLDNAQQIGTLVVEELPD